MKLFTGSLLNHQQSLVSVKNVLIRNLRSVWKQSSGDTVGDGYDTNIQIYNCVAKRKIPLILKNKDLATWYTCGPTIYDSAHIGHASCYLKLDIIQRILREHFGISLVTAMNITDIDDKIIAKCLETKTDWRTLTNTYEKEFWNDLKQLNCKLPDVRLRVTDNIPNICKFIQQLIHNDWAYPVADGSVYFNVKKYTNYGKLQNIHVDHGDSVNVGDDDDDGDRSTTVNVIDEHQSVKKSIQDFALWKSVKKLTDTPNWSSPWGAHGRPGWHIECSTLATMVFGNEIDFHAGGIDLRFPHHENEETQSCAFHCRPQWVNYWIHTGHLHVTGQSSKMSKSLKNTISITELLSEYSADIFRMTCCLSNYRNRMEFNDDVMKLSESVLKKFENFLMDSENYVNGQRLERINNNINRSTVTVIDLYQLLQETKVNVHKYLCDDFNTSKMIEILLILVTETNKFINPSIINSDKVPAESEFDFWKSNDLTIIKCIHNYIKLNLNLLGFIMCNGENLPAALHHNDKNTKTEDIINDLIKLRMDVRELGMNTKNNQFFELSDRIRKLLLSNGIEIKDHGKLSTWKFK